MKTKLIFESFFLNLRLNFEYPHADKLYKCAKSWGFCMACKMASASSLFLEPNQVVS